MSTVVAERLITAEEFLCMEENEGAELVDGRIEEKEMGDASAWIGGRLFARMSVLAEDNDLGTVGGMEFGIQCWPDHPNRVRKPDVLFYRRGRLPNGLAEGWEKTAPDLVVEVVSPNDKVAPVERKLREYREAGIPLIWVIHPDSGTAQVLGANLARTEIGRDGVLDGGDILPGFKLKLSDLFAAANAVR